MSIILSIQWRNHSWDSQSSYLLAKQLFGSENGPFRKSTSAIFLDCDTKSQLKSSRKCSPQRKSGYRVVSKQSHKFLVATSANGANITKKYIIRKRRDDYIEEITFGQELALLYSSILWIMGCRSVQGQNFEEPSYSAVAKGKRLSWFIRSISQGWYTKIVKSSGN